MSGRWIIGIDLGTTHCVLTRIARDTADAHSEVIALPQLISVGQLGEREQLASFLYLPPSGELPLSLPWDAQRDFAVGAYARDRAAEVPGRVVASAKSWLCHPSADRRAGVLPLASPEGVEKMSPVEATWRYLEHLAEAYDQRYAEDGGSLTEQEVVLTVPASFDAAARELTVEAALAAGIDNLTLLEEPQAALYAWLEAQGEGWREVLAPGDHVLVVDVGGGTSDFSVIAVREQDGELSLARVAVGDHILLGGDNMDLALAYATAQALEEQGHELDDWQMQALTHGARRAKERLLADGGRDEASVTVPTRGAKLVGKTLKHRLSRSQVQALVVDGFFPRVDATARPASRPRAGLTKLGLLYAHDPAITKHLAAFLARHAKVTGDGNMLRPTKVLFNGGVMHATALRERLLDTINDWLVSEGAPPLQALAGENLDLAVARGAALYGRTRAGHGVRIRGGSARAYYVGIESSMPAVPGMAPPIDLLCVAPFGMEEGERVSLPDHQLALVVGEPVRFRFFGSSVRRQDAVGAVLSRHKRSEVKELSPISITLPTEGRAAGALVPVALSVALTEVGTLLLEAIPQTPLQPDERWRIELSVRQGAAG